MAKRLSKNGREYNTPDARITRKNGFEYHEGLMVQPNRILDRHHVPSTNPKTPLIVYVVTERVTGPEDGHSSGELEQARFDCGCPAYAMAWQKDGPQATCKHIMAWSLMELSERKRVMEHMLARKVWHAGGVPTPIDSTLYETGFTLPGKVSVSIDGDEQAAWAGC